MSSNLKITQTPSPNQTKDRNGSVPDMIVLHTTGAGAVSARSWVNNPTSQVSYHFIVDGVGIISQHVGIQGQAWANGTTTNGDNRDNKRSLSPIVRSRNINANRYTVSIGFGDMPDFGWGLSPQQIDAAAQLIAFIQSEVKRIYGTDIPASRTNIVGHNEITPVHKPDCPGRQFPWDALMKKILESENMAEDMKIMLDGKVVDISGANMDGTLFVSMVGAMTLMGVRCMDKSNGGVILVSLRDAFELAGAKVTWDAKGNDGKGMAMVTSKKV
jgi:N-acetyl-anhydromuramyl-L-alanine amidase AmpD